MTHFQTVVTSSVQCVPSQRIAHMHLQCERMALRIIRSLHLSDDQTEQLAKSWHAWCRRRRSLDSKLAAATIRFENLLPSTEDFHLWLLAASMHGAEPSRSMQTPVHTSCLEPQNAAARGGDTEGQDAQSLRTETLRGFSQVAVDAAASSQGSALGDTLEESEETEMRHHFMYSVYGSEGQEVQSRLHEEPNAKQVADCVHSSSKRDLDTTNSNGMHCEVPYEPVPTHVQSCQDDRAKKNMLLLHLVESVSAPHPEPDCIATAMQHSVTARPSCLQNDSALKAQIATGTGTSSAQLATAHTAQHSTPAAAFAQAALSRQRGRRMLLGESGYGMRAVECAVAELVAFSYSDFLLLKHSTSFMFGLTPVRSSFSQSSNI